MKSASASTLAISGLMHRTQDVKLLESTQQRMGGQSHCTPQGDHLYIVNCHIGKYVGIKAVKPYGAKA